MTALLYLIPVALFLGGCLSAGVQMVPANGAIR